MCGARSLLKRDAVAVFSSSLRGAVVWAGDARESQEQYCTLQPARAEGERQYRRQATRTAHAVHCNNDQTISFSFFCFCLLHLF